MYVHECTCTVHMQTERTHTKHLHTYKHTRPQYIYNTWYRYCTASSALCYTPPLTALVLYIHKAITWQHWHKCKDMLHSSHTTNIHYKPTHPLTLEDSSASGKKKMLSSDWCTCSFLLLDTCQNQQEVTLCVHTQYVPTHMNTPTHQHTKARTDVTVVLFYWHNLTVNSFSFK